MGKYIRGLIEIKDMLCDLAIFLLPKWMVEKFVKKGRFAFVVHPIDVHDARKRYKFAKLLNKSAIHWWSRVLWPVRGSRVTGLKDIHGNNVDGWIVICPLTTRHMVRNRALGQKRVLQTINFAEKLGAEVVGLGAFTSIATNSGLTAYGKTKSYITTGNAYSAAIALENLTTLLERVEKPLKNATVAVVGGAGSVGSGCSRYLIKKVKKLIIVDKNKEKAEALCEEFKKQGMSFEYSTKIASIKEADGVIVVTNAPGAIIRASHLKEGAVVIDAAQPKNVARRIMQLRDDILIAESAIINTPGVDYDLDLGVRKNESLGCFAEVMVLSAFENKGHFSLGEVFEEEIERIKEKAEKISFSRADFRNSNKFITQEDIERIKGLIHA